MNVKKRISSLQQIQFDDFGSFSRLSIFLSQDQGFLNVVKRNFATAITKRDCDPKVFLLATYESSRQLRDLMKTDMKVEGISTCSGAILELEFLSAIFAAKMFFNRLNSCVQTTTTTDRDQSFAT